MRKASFFLLLLCLSRLCFGEASQYYSAGLQTNPAANTILANTGALNSGGQVGANYEITVVLTGSVAMDQKLEVLNSGGSIVQTIWLPSPANQLTQLNPRAKFFMPNGYSLRVRNNTAVILGGSLQASIIMSLIELVDN